MTEEWRPVVGYEGLYEISDRGRVRRSGNDALGRPRYIGRILALTLFKQGYVKINLYKNSQVKTKKVHCLVAEAFIGPKPLGMDTNHKDGNKTNNCISNLEYITRRANCRHALDVLGHKPPSGERHWKSRMSDKDISIIKKRAASGEKIVDLAREYRVVTSLIRNWIDGTNRKYHKISGRFLQSTVLDSKRQNRLAQFRDQIRLRGRVSQHIEISRSGTEPVVYRTPAPIRKLAPR